MRDLSCHPVLATFISLFHPHEVLSAQDCRGANYFMEISFIIMLKRPSPCRAGRGDLSHWLSPVTRFHCDICSEGASFSTVLKISKASLRYLDYLEVPLQQLTRLRTALRMEFVDSD